MLGAEVKVANRLTRLSPRLSNSLKTLVHLHCELTAQDIFSFRLRRYLHVQMVNAMSILVKPLFPKGTERESFENP